MTTITQAEYDTVQKLAARSGGRFVLNEGVTIKQDPPEAMVKLAVQIVTAAPPHPQRFDRNDRINGTIDALQHMEQALRDLPALQTLGGRTTDWISRTAALKACGADV